jgi:diguanylate cyclase (GGDEF)-like protein
MSAGGHGPVGAARRRTSGREKPGYGTGLLRLAVIALCTAGVVALAGGGDSYWLCVPTVLLASASSQTRLGAVLSTTVVVVLAAAPTVIRTGARPLPSPLLSLLVPAASVAVLVAVRERLLREREALRDVAQSDPLTGIANRRLLLTRADYEIARHHRAQRSFALVMLDLDGFKRLNDRFGHAAGDDLLRDVALALSRSMRAQDTVARIGGDEFCVLAPETDELGTHRLAIRIARAVHAVTTGAESIRGSVGIAVFPGDGVTAATLLRTADEKLLSAKRERHDRRARGRAA